MATQEGTGSSKHFIVKSLAPDWCKSPSSPVAYDIVAFLNESVFTSPNVNFKAVPVFDMASRVATVWGDEPGVGGGVASGVNKGFCRPIVPVTKVRCNGFMTCRHEHTLFLMNCAGPDGPANTIGKVIYLGAQGPGPVTPAGGVPLAANSIVAAQTPGELSCLPKLDQMAGGVGGLDDIAGMAQKAYQLSQVDWNNPMAALGAIGGLAGAAGLNGVAGAISLGQKAAQLAQTDFSNPAALFGAAMNLAGPSLQSGDGTLAGIGSSLLDGASQLGSGLLGAAGKLWTLPNTLLGAAIGGVGHVGKQLANWYDPSTYADPEIGFGHNALEFTNNPFGNLFVPDEGAVTLGNSIIYSGTPDEKWPNLKSTVGNHEKAHTYQAQLLGPLYLPAWGLGAAAAVAQGKPDPFGHDNFMETGPYGDDDPFSWWPL